MNEESCFDKIKPVSALEGLINRFPIQPLLKKILKKANNKIVINFPVRLDSREIKIFTGFRIQYNNSLGPYRGGIRFHPFMNPDIVSKWALENTILSAFYKIPMGGASGGVRINPSKYSGAELERITRRFTFALGKNIGPEYDILCSDISTDSQIMAWILDTYLSTVPAVERNRFTHVVTGKPRESGGGALGKEASCYSALFAAQKWAYEKGCDLSDLSFAIQGFGRLGRGIAGLMADNGATLLAVEDKTGSIYHPDGINVKALSDYSRNNRGVHGFPDTLKIYHDNFMSMDADILIFAAVENQVNQENAKQIKAGMVLEAIHSAIELSGEEVLFNKNIDVLPDVISGSGDAVAGYFEWLQNKRSEKWDKEEELEKLARKINNGYDKARDMAEKHNVNLRTAAFISALEYIDDAYLKRGIFP